METSFAVRLQNPHIWAIQQWDALVSDQTPNAEKAARIASALFLAIATVFTYLMSEAGKALLNKTIERSQGPKSLQIEIRSEDIPVVRMNVSRKLTAVRIQPADYPTAAKTARAWAALAREKEAQAKGEDRTLFGNNAAIQGAIAGSLSRPIPGQEIYVCKDGSGNEQGMIVISPEHDAIYVDYLATHPRNIRSPENETEQNRAQGAGTTLLTHSETRAAELGKRRVHLYPLASAIPFYRKAGYTYTGLEMTKTVAKIAAQVTPSLVASEAA